MEKFDIFGKLHLFTLLPRDNWRWEDQYLAHICMFTTTAAHVSLA